MLFFFRRIFGLGGTPPEPEPEQGGGGSKGRYERPLDSRLPARLRARALKRQQAEQARALHLQNQALIGLLTAIMGSTE